MKLYETWIFFLLLTIPSVLFSSENQSRPNGSAPVKTPAESRHFTQYTDPESGVVSWILKPNTIAMNQQTLYFMNRSMSKDGRYLWFYCMFSMKDSKSLGVLDFKTDEVHYFPETKGCGFSALVDEETGFIYWAHNKKGIFRRSPDPDQKAEKICGIPDEFPQGKIYQIVCHLCFNPDKTKFFLDSRVDNKFFCGSLDIKTGKYTKWAEMDFMFNHAQFNPVYEEPVFICKEFWNDPVSGKRINIPKGKDGVYERLWLLNSKTNFKRLTPYQNGYATHEWWSADGNALYYCCRYGVVRYDLASGKQTVALPERSTHAHSSVNDRWFVHDLSLGPWYRGCSWAVHFYNTETKKDLPIVSKIPAYNSKENESVLHPDPHPQFVADDRYVASTFNVDGKMTVLLTPVKALIEKTK